MEDITILVDASEGAAGEVAASAQTPLFLAKGHPLYNTYNAGALVDERFVNMFDGRRNMQEALLRCLNHERAVRAVRELKEKVANGAVRLSFAAAELALEMPMQVHVAGFPDWCRYDVPMKWLILTLCRQKTGHSDGPIMIYEFLPLEKEPTPDV